MEQPFVIKLPTKQTVKQASPQSDIAEIREMFREINHRYMVYQPPAYYAAIKRAMDIAISMIFIILVMSWIFPIVALLIKLTSKGPVFSFRNAPATRRRFWTARNSVPCMNADADTKQATSNDKRITPVGRSYPLSHLDETPQFYNVLLGDMSIVGPRPHMLYHTTYYSQFIPYYNLRHEVVPGMTGIAQIKGYIGEISIERELRKRVQWDVVPEEPQHMADILYALTTHK